MKSVDLFGVIVGLMISSVNAQSSGPKFEDWERTPVCTNTGQAVMLPGETPVYAQYCVKSYNMKEVVSRIENNLPAGATSSTVIPGFNDNVDGAPLDFGFKDELSSTTYMSMACAATLKVVPVAAWFKHNDNRWEENLEKVLGSGTGLNSRAGFNACSGALKACVRPWSVVFPPSDDANPTAGSLSFMFDPMRSYKEMRLEYLCVPDNAGVGIVVSAQANGKDLPTGQDAKQISFEGLCPSATQYIEPILVLEGANCGGATTVDFTATGKQQCSKAKQIAAGSASCSIKFPASAFGEVLETRGCSTRRAVALATCNFQEGSYHVSATKKMKAMLMKQLPVSARDSLLAVDRYTVAKHTLCTFKEASKLVPGPVQDFELCCATGTLDLVEEPCSNGLDGAMVLSEKMKAQKTKVEEWFAMQNSALLENTCRDTEVLQLNPDIVGCKKVISSRVAAPEALKK